MPALARLDATLSSVFDAERFPASHAIDGIHDTLCASQWQRNAWLSVRVPSGAPIGRVAVYNRDDETEYAEWLSPYEVWVGAAAGDADNSSAHRCSAQPILVPPTFGPFVTDCNGATSHGNATYVTLRQVRVYCNHAHTRARTTGRLCMLMCVCVCMCNTHAHI